MYRKITFWYGRLLSWLLAFSVAVLIIPVSLQIFSRYTALIPSYIWTEEMARFFLVWTVMIGAMLGVRESRHLDRKSTRLNSSHMSISYAVFCLKKKKKIHIIYINRQLHN